MICMMCSCCSLSQYRTQGVWCVGQRHVGLCIINLGWFYMRLFLQMIKTHIDSKCKFSMDSNGGKIEKIFPGATCRVLTCLMQGQTSKSWANSQVPHSRVRYSRISASITQKLLDIFVYHFQELKFKYARGQVFSFIEIEEVLEGN